jgi:hypothetical protein
MHDTTWIRINEGVTAEVHFDLFDYERGAPDDEVEGRLTGRVRLTRKAVADGRFGLPADLPDEER